MLRWFVTQFQEMSARGHLKHKTVFSTMIEKNDNGNQKISFDI